jgi:hypothetical protein
VAAHYVERMRKVLLALVVAAVATVTVVTAVVLSRPADDEKPDRTAAAGYESTPLAAYATDDLAVTRAAFCAAVPEEALVEAVGTEPASATAYGNGDRARLGKGLRDVAHEYGCAWTAPGAAARAWVFAPPITARAARGLARAVRAEPTCEPVPDAPAYGRPSAAAVCDAGGRREVSFRGLFGDAWLTCTLSVSARVPRPDLVDRAGRWCVAVAEAARTR